ncbi:MAG: NAD-dependent epimerase/dehydratase family protein [Acidobacteriota bacterium]
MYTRPTVRIFITGVAGLIGRSLARLYLGRGDQVTGVDSAAEATQRLADDPGDHPSFRFLGEDLLQDGRWQAECAGADVVLHLAANSDIQRSFDSPELDLRQGFLSTQRVLEAMRSGRARRLGFASSSAVYGEPAEFPTPEDYGPLLPVSLYGAAKLASEALISAYAHGYGLGACLFRPANIVGGEATHGVVLDFIHALRRNPGTLRILGDGAQSKPYLHASECSEAMAWALEKSAAAVQAFNITPADAIPVREIAGIVCGALGLDHVRYEFSGGERGWPGDVPRVRLDPARLARLGWSARLSSRQAVERAAAELARNTPPERS